MSNVSIVCPHGFVEDVHSFTLTSSLKDSAGSSRVLCENCFKKFRVHFQDGRISSVKRS
jgi:hypothetical protein